MHNLQQYELLAPASAQLLAVALPRLELFLGICLLGGILTGGTLLVTSLLMGLFVYAQLHVMARGTQIPCGCFGGTPNEPISYATVVRTGGLAMGAAFAYVTWVRNRSGLAIPSRVKSEPSAAVAPGGSVVPVTPA